MGSETKIQWTDHTANTWWGCQEVHAGCHNCYARVWDARYGGHHWGAAGYAKRRPIKSVWHDLAQWQKAAAAAGRRDRVFCGSMMDIFERAVALADLPKGYSFGPFARPGDDLAEIRTNADLRGVLFARVVPASPNLEFLLLTKRPQNIRRMVPPHWLTTWPANVMVGCSSVDQTTADSSVDALCAVPGARRFLSVEPLIGPLSLWPWLSNPSRCDWLGGLPPMIDWVIIGGESGHGARPLKLEWVRVLIEQCRAAHTPVFIKQLGAVWSSVNGSLTAKGDDLDEWPADLRIHEFPALPVLA